MRTTIAKNLADLLCGSVDDEHASWIVEVAVAAATVGGYGDEIHGILRAAFLHLAEAAETSGNESMHTPIGSALKAIEAQLASRKALELVADARQG